MDITEDKTLKCLRIEINSYNTVFLYYKQYPKKDSKRFPQSQTAILFYFDKTLEDKFFYLYMSLIGEIETVELGSYVNRKGSKSKRCVVNFALVKYYDEEALNLLLDQHQSQRLINEFMMNKRNRKINLSYDPMKDEGDNEEGNEDDGSVDEEGFTKVKVSTARNRFSKAELSFKIKKENKAEEEEELGITKKQKENKNDFYWNFQLLDKKRRSNIYSLLFLYSFIVYDDLKTLFEEDKIAIETKKKKLN